MSVIDAQALEHRITTLERDLSAQNHKLDTQDKRLEKMDGELKEIVKLLSSRPTWFITTVITMLTTVTASLIVYVLTFHH